MSPGAVLEVVCTDPMSAIDIPNMVRESGDILRDKRTQNASLFFCIEKAAP